jgi:serine/threonine-protein kinase
VLELCLKKDLKHRIADIHDVRLALEGEFETAPAATPSATIPRAARWRTVAVATAAAAIAGAVLAATAMRMLSHAPILHVARLIIPTGGATALDPSASTRDLVIAPGGERIAYRGVDQILIRALAEMRPIALTGVGATSGLFMSPDGQWVGFASGGQLKKIAASGGAPSPLTSLDGGLRGATWGRDGTIVLATSAATGLARISADGGETTILTTPDPARGEMDHLWPEFLPDGNAVLFTITAATGGLDANRIAIVELSTRAVTVLPLHGTRARYVASGHLIYGANGAVQAVPFEAARRTVVGTPVAVLSPGPILFSGDLQLDVAANGTLVYVEPLATGFGPYSLTWVDRGGRETPITGVPPRAFRHPQLTADGTRVMLSDVGQGDIWSLNLSPPRLSRVTDDPSSDLSSTWLSDGRVVFASSRTGGYRLYLQSADGSGQTARLVKAETTQIGPMTTPDGAGIVFTEVTGAARGGVRLLNLQTGDVSSLVDSPSDERGGIVSPDGRWLAFESNRSGRFEVYVQTFPDGRTGGGMVPVSAGGGVQPRWGPKGQELFYVTPAGAVVSVAVRAKGTVWTAGSPTQLFEGPYSTRDGQLAAASPQYDTLDGQRFLMLKNEAPSALAPGTTEIVVVQNWTEELKRLVPVR